MRGVSASLSETGPVRAVNADALHLDDDTGVYIVADGVGSAPDSVAASATAVGLCKVAVAEALAVTACDDLDLPSVIRRVYPQYRAAFETAPRIPSTTLTIVCLSEGRLHYASVGDSPLFLLDSGGATLLTRDHTLVDQGRRISNFSDLKSQSGANILVNALGPTPPRPTEYPPVGLERPCRLVVCSDGLMEIVTQDELSALSLAAATPADLVAALRNLGNRQQPNDNYTGIVIDICSRRVGDD